MNVSFGGNHLIIAKDEKTRDFLFKQYEEKAYKRCIISRYKDKAILILDGKEEEDYSYMQGLHCPVSGYFRDKLNEGYAKKAIVVDLRDGAIGAAAAQENSHLNLANLNKQIIKNNPNLLKKEEHPMFTILC